MELVYAASALVALGLAVLVAVLVGPRPATSGVARSLELIQAGSGSRTVQVAELTPLSERSAGSRLARPLAGTLVRFGMRISPAGTPQRLRRRMDLAGNTPPWDLEAVLIGKALGTLVLGGLGLVIWVVARSWVALLLAVALAALGYWLTDLLLYNAGVKRQDAIRRAMADAVDMMVICVEAGMGFDGGVDQVARKTRGPLADELSRVIQEMNLGRSRVEAFSDLAARTNVAEMSTFVAALVQADRLGVPVAGVLREQAVEMRHRRRQLAEEKAMKIPVKIIFPVLFCIFPALFIVIIGPGVIKIAQTFITG